jgi:predicted dehydrogenase/aryl-alcohol dehydrogenase-like predicted oxidoreductase
MSTPTLQWGILGTGGIAKTFARGVAASTSGKVVSVGSRTKESADKFAAEFGIANAHGSYEALLADPEVHAVYIAVPHPFHAEWACKAAKARKHLLVEKPLGLNHAEAMVVVEAALDNDVFLMEAFMYRCHPQTAKLVELVKSRAIGDLRVISADFSFHWPKPWTAESRLISNALGGGGILDVGCYPVSMSRLLAGAALGKPFAEPEDVKGHALIGKTGVDEVALGTMKFSTGILAQISTAVQVSRESGLTLYGSEGRIVCPKPWVPGNAERIFVHRAGKDVEEIVVESKLGLYSLEADAVAKYLAQRQSPTMSWEDSLGNAKTLDRWRAACGQVYDAEKPENLKPIPPRRIARQPLAKMKYAEIEGVGKPISRLVEGADWVGSNPRDAYAVYDFFFEQGGNCFDTSHWYGPSDRLLGMWMKNRGVRKECVVFGKGAHSPFCNPDDADRQIRESCDHLERLDVYCFHRDNPKIPVGEFVDLCNRHIREGRIGAWGGSNWTLSRMQDAIEYAHRNNLIPPRVLSNQFSLARMIDPIWGGCIGVSDAESVAWLRKGQVALMPWSSQARGFFVDGMAHPEKKDNAELVRCWYSPDNFKRLERVREMASKRNVLPINIALAFVLNQPFATFPLIGPRTIRECRTSLPAVDIELSADELKWLNLET